MPSAGAGPAGGADNNVGVGAGGASGIEVPAEAGAANEQGAAGAGGEAGAFGEAGQAGQADPGRALGGATGAD